MDNECKNEDCFITEDWSNTTPAHRPPFLGLDQNGQRKYKPVMEEDWEYCPYCGTKLEAT